MRAERIAVGDQPLAAAGGEPVDGEQVLGHVGVEPGAEDPEAPLDDERQRGERDRGERDRDRRAAAPRRRRATAAAQVGAPRPPRRATIATSAAVPSPGRRTVHQASAQSAASPTAGASRDHSTPPAGDEDRLPDERRGAEQDEEADVGAEHRRRA